jgi:hypothetical protein
LNGWPSGFRELTSISWVPVVTTPATWTVPGLVPP